MSDPQSANLHSVHLGSNNWFSPCKCDLCGGYLKFYNNTSALKNHLVSTHPLKYDDLMAAELKRKTALQALTSAAPSPAETHRRGMQMSNVAKERTDRLFALWCAQTCQPLSVFSQPALQEALDYISCGSYKPPSQHGLNGVSMVSFMMSCMMSFRVFEVLSNT